MLVEFYFSAKTEVPLTESMNVAAFRVPSSMLTDLVLQTAAKMWTRVTKPLIPDDCGKAAARTVVLVYSNPTKQFQRIAASKLFRTLEDKV